MAERSRMMNLHSSILQVASIIKNNEQKKSEESFEIEKKKRERQANYTKEETERLIALALQRKDIIENKKNGSDQWQEKKQAWEDIEKSFNRKSDGLYRDSKNLKSKYESIKRDIKKKWSNIVANQRNPDGRLPKFTSTEKKMKEVMQLPLEEGFCDFNDYINNKSDDDDDDAYDDGGSDSSPSDVNTKESDGPAIKTELVVYSDDDVLKKRIESNNVLELPIDFDDGEPPNKRLRQDPLVSKTNGSEKSEENEENEETNEEKIQEAQLETIRMQQNLLREELVLARLQKAMMEQDMAQKKAIHLLEKEHLLLKIEAFKCEKWKQVNKDQ